MNNQQVYWNNIIKETKPEKPDYDLWLNKYDDILNESKDLPIIDLGCGWGADTLFLIEKGYKVIACDFSKEAVKRVKKFIPSAKVMQFDMLDGLPFKDKETKIVISDLSLHYFSLIDTKRIISEIRRVLVENGVLICRVNSVNDINYGAGQGIQIEENFYYIDGVYKRFFDEQHINMFFEDWETIYINEYSTNKYNNRNKVLWEIAVKNI